VCCKVRSGLVPECIDYIIDSLTFGKHNYVYALLTLMKWICLLVMETKMFVGFKRTNMTQLQSCQIVYKD